ncbi:uncharacterized protein LOC113284723 [Papaver somniferum]|uniref:uncharacterized protein LOC113284723 n=1 Tax=Papaver somniferum TaxID=3469 RepID=UPI000E702C03|nr:uncharacterized protein LOC113284723 [Papaver somniferum]XP_026389962.1 uncharacterized protein LOC113284723 [Papaver somniferum]XP_026389963.1 uncharacterized protein LOC113284723 [Papaver somniferum]XP_026389964.1 uncharacterized protein LOC113284723 [Papaver somniferum]
MITNVAWMAVPVLNLQGVNPFEEQVEELVQVIQQNMDIQNGDGAQANQEPVIEAENNYEEVNEAGEDNIALNVAENDTEVSKNQNDEGNEEVNKEIIVDIGVDNSANGTYVSEINRFDLRTNKRRRTEDVILEAMEMKGYIQEIDRALHVLADEVVNDGVSRRMELGESSSREEILNDIEGVDNVYGLGGSDTLLLQMLEIKSSQ